MNFLILLLALAGSLFSPSVKADTICVPGDFQDIQAAVNAAGDGDTVLVADGTYSGEGFINIRIAFRPITVASENGPGTCAIDCRQEGTGFEILFTPDEVVIDGFTIQNGFTDEIGGGGAIFCIGSTVRIQNCILKDNRCIGDWCAGGIISFESGELIIRNSIIMDNGGNGWVWEDWGGIYHEGSVTIENTVVTGNSGRGLAIAVSRDETINLNFCTVTANTGTGVSFRAHPDTVIKNCIVRGNAGGEFGSGVNGPGIVSYSNIQDRFPGIGNIDADPLFQGVSTFLLSPASPCIDAGTDREIPETDITGNPRVRGAGPDMGAYEYRGWPSFTRSTVHMPGHDLTPGSQSRCTVTLWNSSSEVIDDAPLFVILSLYGSHYFAPDFTGYDYFSGPFPPGETTFPVIHDFVWPSGTGSGQALWMTAVTDPGRTTLVTPVSFFDFSWSN